ncbi:MAG TPA: zf-HC2 domain-containing protein, partial [Gemmatimonadaceae bacterium]
MTEQNAHLDEGTIHAWLDGALPPDESARVEAHVAQCAACGALVAEARGLVAASSRILSSLDAVPAGVIPGATREVDQLAALRARRRASRRSWFRDPRVVAAASLVFMAGTAGVVWQSTRGNSTPMEQASESVVADQVQAPAPLPAAPLPAAPPAPRPPDARSADLSADVASRQRAAFVDSISSAKVAASVPARETDGTVGAAANEARRERADVSALRQAPAQAQAGAPSQTSAAAPPPAQVEQQSRLQALGAAQGALRRRISSDTGGAVAAPPAERSLKALSPG